MHLALAVLLATACGSTAIPASSPLPTATPSGVASISPSPAPSPSPGPAPSPRPVTAGSAAYVSVAVATLWRSPTSPRPADAGALGNPVRIRSWLAGLSWNAQYGLIGRADSQMLLGDRVTVLALSAGWAQVVVPDQATPQDPRGYPGWVPLAQLTGTPAPESDQFATVITPTTWLYRGATASVEVSLGTRLPVLKIGATTAVVGLPGGDRLEVPLLDVALTARSGVALPRDAGAIMATARSFLGLRYLWAGTSGFGYDCSGLMYTVFKAHGVLLPRDAQDQARVGTAVGRQSLQPGDLVFFAAGGAVHHVALYVGSGMLLDSPDIGKGVQLVSISAEPYASEFSGARRMIG